MKPAERDLHRQRATWGVALGALAAAVLLLVDISAWACGPAFSFRVLSSRGGTLHGLPEGRFALEASRLVPAPDDSLTVDEASGALLAEAQAEAEQQGLDERQKALLVRARAANEASTAYALGAGLPEDVRRYVAGAVAYRTGQLLEADRRFRSVLALPPAQRRARTVWAEFSRARMEVEWGRLEEACAGFQRVRAAVAEGHEDNWGLGVASLGAEAKVRLDQGRLAEAVRLYAEQAARGSLGGNNSLLFVARRLFREQPLLEERLKDPLVARLAVIYAWSNGRALDEVSGQDWDWPRLERPEIEVLLAALERAGVTQVAGGGQLAALAYRSGRFELAERWVQLDASPLTEWLKAKLALRRGELDRAAAHYAAALRALPADESWCEEWKGDGIEYVRPQQRVLAELGVLELGRGQFVTALDHLLQARGYWTDAAFVAERVLTVDELLPFVRERTSLSDSHDAGSDSAGGDSALDGSDFPSARPPGPALRALLARRLLREGRDALALGFFDETTLRAQAERWLELRRRGARGDRLERAQAWFEAARLLRASGMELLGYEGEPDWSEYAGAYERPVEVVDAGTRPLALRDENLTTSDERRRVRASAAQPPQRFHYRWVALEQAERSLSLLPSRSQPFSAVLCQAYRWSRHHDPQAARALYRRFVREGAGAWMGDSSASCPAPDWADAARHLAEERRRALAGLVPVALALLAGLVGVGAWRLRRRAR